MARLQHTNEPTEAAASPATRLRSNEPVKALLRELDETLQRISADGEVVVYEVHIPDTAGLKMMSAPLFRFLKTAAAGIPAMVAA